MSEFDGDFEKIPNISEDSNKLLNLLHSERVFGIDKRENTTYLKELCDEWYSIELTKDICLKLAKLFKELAGTFKDGEVK